MNNSPGISWFRNSIVYQILVDRFAGYDPNGEADKPVFLGGNIAGITEKLSYLQDLGINTIWISPIQKTTAYHGYHITDYYSIDERFGTEAELKALIAQAHKRNIRVILDFVANHCSREHPIFREAVRDTKSPYRRWFYFSAFTNQYLCFLKFRELPKINLDFPDARKHIIESARKWISMGADGFRLDHVVGPSHDFWKAFSREIKALNPEAVLIGEAWLEGITAGMLKTIRINHKYLRWLLQSDPWGIQREYLHELDGVLDFYFHHRVVEYIAWKERPDLYEKRLRSAMTEYYRYFPEDYYLPTFVDNHDMNRFLYDAGQNREKLKVALRIQFSLPQPPILYYGTETGLTHHDPVQLNVPYSDLFARQPMPWHSLDRELIEYCRDLIQERKKK
jgi:cyclomaltodextrinase / maltogenic alpha-amylase / neopullulanase